MKMMRTLGSWLGVVALSVALTGCLPDGDKDKEKNKAAAAPASSSAAASSSSTSAGKTTGWPIDQVQGKADAPITVIEYSSLTCPHCARFHLDTYPKFKAEWIDTGKARLIFRDLPWDDAALAAAMIAHCSEDRYFSFVEAFFSTQAGWAHSANPLGGISQIARLGGMSENQLNSCLKRSDLMAQIRARKDEALNSFQVKSTPSFLINGRVIDGNMPYEAFVKELEKK